MMALLAGGCWSRKSDRQGRDQNIAVVQWLIIGAGVKRQRAFEASRALAAPLEYRCVTWESSEEQQVDVLGRDLVTGGKLHAKLGW